MKASSRRVLLPAFLVLSLTMAAGSAAEPTHQGESSGAPTLAAAGPTGLPAGTLVAPPELVRHPTFSAAGVVETRSRRIQLAGIVATAVDLQCGVGGDTWPCGKVARTALQRFVRGRTLECRIPDVGAARCTLAGQDVGEWLVSQGWAAAADFTYAGAEKTAKEEKRGIWSPARTGPFQTFIAGPELGLADAVLRAEIELSTQSMVVTYRGQIIGDWPVSTARDGKETPTGVWTAKWLSRDHRSSLYDDAPMPYSIFFEGDYAIHGTYQVSRLGQAVSHGCVRLSPTNAKRLFSLVSKEGVDNMLIVIRP